MFAKRGGSWCTAGCRHFELLFSQLGFGMACPATSFGDMLKQVLQT